MAANTPDDALPPTMKAWRYHKAAGGAEKHMQVDEIPLPANPSSLPADSTLIKVHTVALNPVDIKFSEVPLIGQFLHPFPAIPGLDGVGRVVKTTDASVQPGQLVMFRKQDNQKDGALAEYALVPHEGCLPIPAGVSPIQAATVGTCGVTAYQALAPYLKLGDDQKQPRVFINGGSGGTGTFQIQVAKALGCYVATSCSTPNVELCKSLGADEVIDYRQKPVEEALPQMVQQKKTEPFDLFVDNVHAPWRRYRVAHQYLTPEGRYVQIGADMTWSGVRELICIMFTPSFLGGGKRPWTFKAVKTSRADAERVLGWMAEGKMKIPIDSEFSFESVPEAYKKLKEGRARGKMIVHVAEE